MIAGDAVEGPEPTMALLIDDEVLVEASRFLKPSRLGSEKGTVCILRKNPIGRKIAPSNFAELRYL